MRHLIALSPAVVAAFLAACGPSETRARALLEKDGLVVETVTKDGDAFVYTGTRGKDLCHGRLVVARATGDAARGEDETCERDSRACKPGATAECLAIADELYVRDASVFPQKAAELYRVACDDRDGRACGRVAEFERIDKAWAAVRSFAAKGCELGSGEACRHLAVTELEGQGTEKDTAKAEEHARKACDLGDRKGCRIIAGLLVDERRAEEALPIAERLCASGDAGPSPFEDGCLVLGVALFDLKRDPERALRLLEDACKDPKLPARGYACNLAGTMYLGGHGVPRAPEDAVARHEASCALDHADGCANAARAYSGTPGVPRDRAKAAAFTEKACRLGKSTLCGGG